MIRTVLHTQTAVDRFFTVYRSVMLGNSEGLFRAVHHARTRETSLTCVRNHVVRADTCVACFVQNCEHRPCRRLTLKRLFCIACKRTSVVIIFNGTSKARKYAHAQNFAVMINTAADRGTSNRRHFARNVMNSVYEFSFKLQLRNADENFSLELSSVIIDVKHVLSLLVT